MRTNASNARQEESGPGLGSKAIALVILLVAAYLLFKVVIGVVTAVAWFVVIVLAVVGVVWALSVLNRR
jgi:Flp pilus assembly protein TadB